MRSYITFYPPEFPAHCKRCKCKMPYSIMDPKRPKFCSDCWAKAAAEDAIKTLERALRQPAQEAAT